jgi:two-component system, OmpR family, sensor histidine kinase BaeS
MKMSLRLKLILSYSALSLLLTLLLLLAANKLLDRQFIGYMEGQQEIKNSGIAAAVAAEYDRTGAPSQEFYMALGQSELSQGVVLMVNDRDGNQLFCMSECSQSECDDMLGMMSQTMGRLYPALGGKYMEKTYPLISGGSDVGTVTLGYYGPFSVNDADIHFISKLNRVFLAAAIAFLAAAVVLGAWMADRISKPLKSVIAKTKQIEAGHYADRIASASNTREIRELIDSVNALADALQTQQAVKKRMAGDYAHEFRTPLAALQSQLEGMIDGIFTASPERLDSLRAEILRLSRMVSEIDKIVALESDAPVLALETVDLAELTRLALFAFERQMLDKRVTLTMDAEPCILAADRDKISQVLVNLISNAVKYTQEGGGIDIKVTCRDDAAVFTIANTGEGIAPEDLPHLFENLYRADVSRARGTGGSGIGLSVVKAIVNAHGGSVTAKSEPGKGSEFTVTLNK